MARYFLDTNILIHHQRGNFNIGKYLSSHDIDVRDCFISEIVEIEMKVGQRILERKGYKLKITAENLLSNFQTVPISSCIDFFCSRKM